MTTDVVHPKVFQRQKSAAGSLTHVNETKVALFRFDDQVFALNEKCPHAGGPLHLGDIEVLPDSSLCVKCPWHSWRFDIGTGKVKHPVGQDRNATVYPVKVTDDGSIHIGFDQFSDHYFTNEDF